MNQESCLKFIAGDKQCFQEIFNNYIHGALRTAKAITKNEEMAKDAVQETFIRVYKNRTGFDANKSFSPWFYRILVNECKRILKREANIFKFNRPLDKDEQEIPDEAQDDYSDLYEAVQSLSSDFRIPIILKYLKGFSEKEIAEIMELNQNTVKTRLFKGRSMLKKKLAADTGGGIQYGC